MSSFITGLSKTSVYEGETSRIEFSINDDNALAVTIDTHRLHIRSVESSEQDISSYAALFGNPDVMEKYATGTTNDRKQIEDRINNVWVKRWHQNDPYSGLAVFKKETDEFLGHVVLGHGDEEAEASLAFLLRKEFWRQRYGTESVTALVKDYAPATVHEGYTLEGKTLTRITATARPDNPASVRILQNVGMEKIGEEEKFGAIRYHFSTYLKC